LSLTLFIPENPVGTDGTLTILGGCDYAAADGSAARFINPAGTWPNLTGTKPYLIGYRGNHAIPVIVQPGILFSDIGWNSPPPIMGPIAGTVIVAQGPNQEVRFDLPAGETAMQPCGSPNDLYSYAVIVQLAGSLHVIPLQTGPLNVLGAAS
jgi:hypothetical protein